jgi:opacity protein-like surface antigen
MKKLIAFALVFASLTPAASAQTSPSFTGKWEGTFTLQRPDGTEGNSNAVVFNITQKGKIENGAVAAGTATFQLQQPDGPLFTFTLSIVKGRLQGEMTGQRDGVVRGKAKVDAAKVDPAKAK